MGLISVGFSGSRRLHRDFSWQFHVSRVVRAVMAGGGQVVVGCAAGLDAMVRQECPQAVVFRAANRSAAALVNRSTAMVRHLAAQQDAVLAIWPARACPAGLRPSQNPSRCFCGSGSGTWASAALAAGLGCQVVVFGSAAPDWWGAWSAGSGLWSSGLVWSPPVRPVQQSLF